MCEVLIAEHAIRHTDIQHVLFKGLHCFCMYDGGNITALLHIAVLIVTPGFPNCLCFFLQDLAVIPLSSQPESDSSSDSGSSSESEGGSEEESEGGREEAKRFPLRLPKGTRHKKRTITIQELPCR